MTTANAGNAGQPRHGVGGKHRSRLVARVDHANAALTAAHQNGRNMPAGQGENEAHAMRLKRLCHMIAAMHTVSFDCTENAHTLP